MKDAMRKILAIVFIDLSVLGIALIYKFLLFDKAIVGNCFFREMLGIYCPACGGSRSLSSLISFNIVSSFVLYPPIIISIIVILFYEIRYIFYYFRKKPAPVSIFSKYFVLLIPISIILNYIIKCILLYCFDIDLIEIGASLNF